MEDFIEVVSSNIAGFSYDKEKKELTIRFLSGAEYSYSGVPIDVKEGLFTSESKGRYFHKYIKNAYKYERIS